MAKKIIDNITDALSKKVKGSLELKVWIAEQHDEKTFTVVDEKTTTKLVIENVKILQKAVCSEGKFLKLMQPSVTSDGKGLIVTDNSRIFPLRATKGVTFQDKPAAFIPCYTPPEKKEVGNDDVDSETADDQIASTSSKSDYGSLELECAKPIGEVSKLIFRKLYQI